MTEKMTEKMMYNFIMETMSDNDEVVEFCDKKIAAIEKKNAKAKERAAEKRAAGDELRAVVSQVLTHEWQSLADICAQIEGEDVSTSKITYRLTSLVNDGVAEKNDMVFEVGDKKLKRKAYRLVKTV